MYIENVPNRASPPAVLLRESYRVGANVTKRTLLNPSDWPPGPVDGLHRALPHGQVATVLGVLRAIKLDRLIGRPMTARLRDMAVALVVSRIIEPASKLATARDLEARSQEGLPCRWPPAGEPNPKANPRDRRKG